MSECECVTARYRVMDLLKKAGIPDGVVNIVNGHPPRRLSPLSRSLSHTEAPPLPTHTHTHTHKHTRTHVGNTSMCVCVCALGAVDVVNALCDHPGIQALTFVGSSKVCLSLGRQILSLLAHACEFPW